VNTSIIGWWVDGSPCLGPARSGRAEIREDAADVATSLLAGRNEGNDERAARGGECANHRLVRGN
jgi:hypothetical protein